MLYCSGAHDHIDSGKLIMDKVFKNKHEKKLAENKKYLYFKVLSKLRSKFQNNKDVTGQLFHTPERPKTTSKLSAMYGTVYKV